MHCLDWAAMVQKPLELRIGTALNENLPTSSLFSVQHGSEWIVMRSNAIFYYNAARTKHGAERVTVRIDRVMYHHSLYIHRYTRSI